MTPATLRRLLAALCLMLGILPLQAGLFDSDSLLELTITANWTEFLADRGNNPDYHEASMQWTSPQGAPVQMPVEVRVRGNFRRDAFTCYFPPVRVKFPKKALAPFDGQDKLKLVTHCNDDQYILREYYIYKVYSLLTPFSFRVRLARITYHDSKGQRPDETHFAFFIESEEELAARNGESPVADDVPLTPESVDPEQLTMVHLFNYMISNLDFEVELRQNLKAITNGRGKPLLAPYDFDWSGMVDAPYTKSSTAKGSAYYARRSFKPLCRTEAEYAQMLARFQAIRPQLIAIYEESPYLDKKIAAESLKYYRDFYKTASKPGFIEEVLRAGCRAE
ncbi:MAG: hypothetical protein NW241_02925 [Bacteroidia bacterium]|nr:hypothetical protein [Bacteroidia bacterium]